MPAHGEVDVVEVEGVGEGTVGESGLGRRGAEAGAYHTGVAVGGEVADVGGDDLPGLLAAAGNADGEGVENGALGGHHRLFGQRLVVGLDDEPGELLGRTHGGPSSSASAS